MKPSKSGSRPAARSSSIWLSSASMSLVRAMASGDTSLMAPAIWLNQRWASCWRSWSSSSSNRSRASLDTKSYCCSSRTMPLRSGGRRSSSMRRSAMASPVTSWRRTSPDSRAPCSSWSSVARSVSTTSRSCWAMSSYTPPRSCSSSRARRCSRRRSMSSLMPWTRSPLRSSNPELSMRRRAAFRSPWYSRSSLISDSTESASSSNPTWVPSQREYRTCGRRAATRPGYARDPSNGPGRSRWGRCPGSG